MRIGNGYDVHAFAQNRKLIIGGVEIPYSKGLMGHSDADVLVHSIMDALLGAAGLGDIGSYFPDTDISYKDIDSMFLLYNVINILKTQGYKIVNIDSIIVAQKPKMLPYIKQMKENISKVCEITAFDVGIKATTTEKLGFIGREEGIGAYAVVLLDNK